MSVPPPATRADADRERIAAALYRHEWPGKQVWEQALAMDRETSLAQADAVLAVLPEPADRADRVAVLAEVADWLKAWRPEFFERWAITEQERYEGGVDDAAAELRRLAAEAQQPDDEALRAKVDEATATLRRIRSTIRTLKDQGATGRAYYQAITDDLAGPRPDRCEAGDEQPSGGPVAGEQQNETPEAEAHPAEHSWAAELHDPLADEWVPGTRYAVRERAVNALTHSRRLGPTWADGSPTERRLVRATTTYTVEPDPEPAVEAPE